MFKNKGLFYNIIIQKLIIVFIFLCSSGKVPAYENAVVTAPLSTVRSKPAFGSEQVTQVLYNQRIHILGESAGWYKVLVPDQYRTESGYPGWIPAVNLAKVKNNSFNGGSWAVVSAPSTTLYSSLRADHTKAEIYFGTYLRYLGYVEDKSRKWQGKPVYWLRCISATGREGWIFYAHADIRRGSPFSDKAYNLNTVDTASMFQDVPYEWGGMTARGIDCSGLTYMVYLFHGRIIPRDADQQFLTGRRVDMSLLEPGDLVFYGSAGNITHVGIFTGSGWVIHASRSKGVICESFYSENLYSRYMGAVRIIE